MAEFSDLLLAIYRAARELPMEAFQDAALEIIKPVLAFDSCTWATGEVMGGGLIVHSAHLYREFLDRLEAYEEVKTQDVVAFAASANIGKLVNSHAPTIYQGRDKTGIREYARRYRHQNILATANLDHDTQILRWIGLYRADADEQYAQHDMQLYHALVPHLMEALTLNRTLNMARANNDRRRHTALTDRRGVLHHMEPGFADLMREEWPDWLGRYLPGALHEALSKGGERYDGRTMILASHRIQDLLFLKARKRLPIDGLTARELVVARHVATGLTHKEIARELTLSPATVRVHLQRIHDKLNTRNNAELAAQLALIDH